MTTVVVVGGAGKGAGIFSGVSDTILWVDGATTATNGVFYLERAGFIVECVAHGAALRAFPRVAPMLVILDIASSAPDGWNGLATCRSLRARSAAPILVLTAENTESDVLRRLEHDADDYLPRPFSPRELVARVTAILRRALPETSLTVGSLVLDLEHHDARLAGAELALTPGELKILATLMRRPGRVFRREELLAAFPEGARAERAIDAHISNLRKKLARSTTPHLETVRGVGYRLSEATR